MGEDIFDCIELPIYFSMFSSNDLSDFKMLMASRVIGGLGCGMIFTLLPTYMKELLNIKNSSSEIVDILITQFGLGICLQYFMGEFHQFCYKIVPRVFNIKKDICEIVAAYICQRKLNVNIFLIPLNQFKFFFMLDLNLFSL